MDKENIGSLREARKLQRYLQYEGKFEHSTQTAGYNIWPKGAIVF